MIYTFGCSATKWHWPTWADWLWAYGHDVTNLAGKGYCHNFINWTLLDIASTITPNDHVVIMWPNNHRMYNGMIANGSTNTTAKDFSQKHRDVYGFHKTPRI